jgi:hypothetical protein
VISTDRRRPEVPQVASNRIDRSLERVVELAPPGIRDAVHAQLVEMTEIRRGRIRRFLDEGPIEWSVPDPGLHDLDEPCDLFVRVNDDEGTWRDVWLVVRRDPTGATAWMVGRSADTPVDLRDLP